jgi:DNA-directed RNA polymerase subunit RPC12/RpoP
MNYCTETDECIRCGDEVSEDLYADEYGPLCNSCFDELAEMENERLTDCPDCQENTAIEENRVADGEDA